jgi:hypothetical protein
MDIPEGVLPLLTGTVLALSALSIVLSPLLSGDEQLQPAAPAKRKAASREGTAIAALREIEFDKATGKLSDGDYESLRATYTREALTELRAADNAAAVNIAAFDGPVTDDIVEAAIRRAKDSTQTCAVCGPRPESDAIFCSSCSRYLAGSCGNCGTAVELVGARFCTGCGEGLIAA